VICGGAALTRKYVEDDLRREYSNAVFYADDAFGGLHIMADLVSESVSGNGVRAQRLAEGRKVKEYVKAAVASATDAGPVTVERSPVVGDAPNIPVPPFYGVRVKISIFGKCLDTSMRRRCSKTSGNLRRLRSRTTYAWSRRNSGRF
jgi:5-methyltetrahydrofolate--homocysteine methyltransferase